MRITTGFAFLASLMAMCLANETVAQPSPCPQCAAWDQKQEPFRLFGNTYYVGPRGLSAVLVTSEAGHVLIDGALPQSVPQIVANIKALGFRIEDVKFIVNSHAHYDHAGGIAGLQQLSGAEVKASPYSMEALQRGAAGPGDPQYSQHDRLPPAKNVSLIRDREVIRVGPIALTAVYTPGHTPGGTTWTWQSCEGQECLNMVYADSLTAVSSDDFRFTGSFALEQLRTSMGTVEQLPCDIMIAAHPEFAGLWKAHARVEKEGRKAFVDKEACRKYAAGARAWLEKRLEKERASAK